MPTRVSSSLDELPEFRRTVLEGLATPLRDGAIHLARTHHPVSFPARFHLLGTMNACPCGLSGHGHCQCTPDAVRRYHARVPPLLAERFDITLDVGSTFPTAATEASHLELSTAACQAQVLAALERQAHRYTSTPEVSCNAQLPASLIARFCPLTPTASTLLAETLLKTPLDWPVHVQLLAVARTCADVHGHERLYDEDVALALSMPPFALAATRAVSSHP